MMTTAFDVRVGRPRRGTRVGRVASGAAFGAVLVGATGVSVASAGRATPGQAAMAPLPSAAYAYPLKVGPTGRYLVDQAGKPFFLVGDAAWSLIAQLSDQHAEAYLADRQQRGFNAVLVNLVEHEFSTRAPADIYGFRPFTGRAFTTPNEEYFAHADRILQSAARKGIVVLLAPDYLGFACGRDGWCAETRRATVAEMRAWGRYVGNRYRSYDNIVWLIGGDMDPTPVRANTEAMVEGILSADARHLFTAHNARRQMAVAPWNGAPWLSVNNTYTDSLEYRYAASAYALSPARPFFLIEARYENDRGTTPQTLRAQSYWTVLSGGFGHVFGNCPIWSFGTSPAFCSSTNWEAALAGQGSQDMSRFQTLFTARHWYRLVPDLTHAALTEGYGTFGGDDYANAAVAADGSSLIAYLPTSRAVTVSGSHLEGKAMRAWWFNPGSGVATLIGTYPTRGTRTFTPPAGGDWVLVVDSRSFDFPAPGEMAPPASDLPPRARPASSRPSGRASRNELAAPSVRP